MQELRYALKAAAKNLFNTDIEPEVTRPDERFGDYSTNIALKLALSVGKNPREIAQQLADDLKNLSILEKVEVAGPGFLNLRLTDEAVGSEIRSVNENYGQNQHYAGQTVVLEHTDPNPFKEFHIGHAYSNTVGTAIGKLMANSGAEVRQVSYHGDVGLHIAMAIFGLKNSENQDGLGMSYAAGAGAYKDDPQAKKEIDRINELVYSQDDPEINRLYEEGRKRSLEAFNKIYERLEVTFEKQYFESEVAIEGIQIVRENIGKVFQESDGAIIYDGEKVGLHKRVFITSQGLPTYEAKEIGLAFAKERDYPNASSFIVITANEIDDYFRVLVAAIKEINGELATKIRHISHGVVKLASGKMSSRTGQVVTLTDLQTDIEQKIRELYGGDKASPDIVFGALKYEYLKHRVGGDFIFDIDESISLQGNSGPYLQYAYARARSIIQKAGDAGQGSEFKNFEPAERSLARKISEYPEAVHKATAELMPHHVATYLYELAQAFNRFYEHNQVIGDPRARMRLSLVRAYSQVLKNGLGLLNIAAPERM